MRLRWSNRLTIVDRFLAQKNIKAARSFAQAILADPSSKVMLSEDELDFLKLVVTADQILDDMQPKDDRTEGAD